MLPATCRFTSPQQPSGSCELGLSHSSRIPTAPRIHPPGQPFSSSEWPEIRRAGHKLLAQHGLVYFSRDKPRYSALPVLSASRSRPSSRRSRSSNDRRLSAESEAHEKRLTALMELSDGPFTTRSGRTIPCEVWRAKATASSSRGFRRTRPPPPHISQWWSMSGGCTHRSPDVRQHSSLSTFLRQLPPVSFRRPCARLRDRPRAFAMYDPT
jgi:hypothetical protein